ncbi:VWA domain-containing protein, partial [Thermodesulfobacteriota bacterium]
MKKTIYLFIFILLLFPVQFYSWNPLFIKVTSHVNAQEGRDGLDIVLVMDNSGSMKKNDPGFLARDVVSRFLIGLKEKSRLGMLIFDSQVKLTVNLMETTSSEARANILNSLDNMNYKGLFSDIPGAIERAIYELKTHSRKEARKVIILLTDGIVDTGNTQQDQIRGKWLREDLTLESQKVGIKIIGIAFTDMADFSLIQTLAIKTGGEYFRAYRAEDIQDIFDRIKKILSKQAIKPAPLTTPVIEPEKVIPPPPPALEQKRVISPVAKTVPPAPSEIKAVPPLPVPIKKKAAPMKETVFPKDTETPLLLVLTGIFISLMVIIIIMIYYYRKAKDSIEDDMDAAETSHSTIPKAVLIDINNITGNKTLALENRVNMIGRDPNNDVVIPKDTVSSFHAIIEYRDDFFYLEDQRSVNKTSLGGEEVKPHS